ncbi:MAG: DUF493 domain-containing protein [Candidatus Omnitrophota bacterium]
MEKNSDTAHAAHFHYPCEWEYRIIGPSEQALKSAVSQIFCTKKCDLSFSHKSSTGKYISLILKTVVESENERNNIYIALRKHAAIKSVL